MHLQFRSDAYSTEATVCCRRITAAFAMSQIISTTYFPHLEIDYTLYNVMHGVQIDYLRFASDSMKSLPKCMLNRKPKKHTDAHTRTHMYVTGSLYNC